MSSRNGSDRRDAAGQGAFRLGIDLNAGRLVGSLRGGG